jgi:hypothetical protein
VNVSPDVALLVHPPIRFEQQPPEVQDVVARSYVQIIKSLIQKLQLGINSQSGVRDCSAKQDLDSSLFSLDHDLAVALNNLCDFQNWFGCLSHVMASQQKDIDLFMARMRSDRSHDLISQLAGQLHATFG